MFFLLCHCYSVSLGVSNISTLIYLLTNIAVSQTLDCHLLFLPYIPHQLQAYSLSALCFPSKVATNTFACRIITNISAKSAAKGICKGGSACLHYFIRPQKIVFLMQKMKYSKKGSLVLCNLDELLEFFFLCVFNKDIHNYYFYGFFPAISKSITWIWSILGLAIWINLYVHSVLLEK